MSKGTVGLLVFLYCLKTLGWVATTLGVFLALSYLRSWLQSAWKKEIERSVSLRNGENDGEERSSGESRIEIENTENNRNVPFNRGGLSVSTSSSNLALPKYDL